MFEWFTEFMESPLGKLISTGILAVAVLLLTLAAAGLVNRLMKKLVDRHRKTNSSIATVLGFVRYIAVAAVYFAGGMVIVGAIPVLSSAVRTLLGYRRCDRGGCRSCSTGSPRQRGQRHDDPRIQAV